MLIRLFQQTTTGSVEDAEPNFSEDPAGIPVEVCQRRGLRRVLGGLSLAGWFRMSALRNRRAYRLMRQDAGNVLAVGTRFR